VQDATFELERKRNRPEKYNRILVQKSVKAMKKILEIRKVRQDRFYENRCVGASYDRGLIVRHNRHRVAAAADTVSSLTRPLFTSHVHLAASRHLYIGKSLQRDALVEHDLPTPNPKNPLLRG
jgi:hypothetical protein